MKIALGLFIGYWIGGTHMFVSNGTCGKEADMVFVLIFGSMLIIPALMGYQIGKEN